MLFRLQLHMGTAPADQAVHHFHEDFFFLVPAFLTQLLARLSEYIENGRSIESLGLHTAPQQPQLVEWIGATQGILHIGIKGHREHFSCQAQEFRKQATSPAGGA